MPYRSRHADAPEMFDALHAQVRREFGRTAWRDRVWAGAFGFLVAPGALVAVSIPVYNLLGLELAFRMQRGTLERFGGRAGILGMNWRHFVVSWGLAACGLALWALPRLHARRWKRLWGT